MTPKYKPKTTKAKLAHLVEEAGEVVSAAGKSLRFGLDSVNPDLPRSEQETNRHWLMREMADLEAACRAVRKAIDIYGRDVP
ncbi:MAG TPA: hypothetical protein VEC60_17335 [Reyranella sp.]|nr:hypothetical protein [Reyranella sp.]